MGNKPIKPGAGGSGSCTREVYILSHMPNNATAATLALAQAVGYFEGQHSGTHPRVCRMSPALYRYFAPQAPVKGLFYKLVKMWFIMHNCEVVLIEDKDLFTEENERKIIVEA